MLAACKLACNKEKVRQLRFSATMNAAQFAEAQIALVLSIVR